MPTVLMPKVQSLMHKANVTGIGKVHYSPFHYSSNFHISAAANCNCNATSVTTLVFYCHTTVTALNVRPSLVMCQTCQLLKTYQTFSTTFFTACVYLYCVQCFDNRIFRMCCVMQPWPYCNGRNRSTVMMMMIHF